MLERQGAGCNTIKWDLLMLILGQITTSKFMSVCRDLLNSQRWSAIMGCDSTYPKEWGCKWSLCHIAVSFLESCLLRKDTKQLGECTKCERTWNVAEGNQHFYWQPPSIFVPLMTWLPRSRYLIKSFDSWSRNTCAQTRCKQPSRLAWSSITMDSVRYNDAFTVLSCQAMNEIFRFSYIKHDTCTLKQHPTVCDLFTPIVNNWCFILAGMAQILPVTINIKAEKWWQAESCVISYTN